MASMESPFPGMDPYVEGPRHWKDFHFRFINDLSDAIGDRLPANYVARIQEDVLLLSHDVDDPTEEPTKLVEPDLNVVRVGGAGGGPVASGSGTSVMEPVTIANVQRLDPHTQPFLEIRRLPDQELACVLELMSRSNKSGEGRGLYLEKRERLLREPVALVEIDLLRSGRRLELARPLPPAHYYAFVSRAERRPWCDVYAWTVRDPLPAVPIPLLAPDGEIWVDLAPVFRRTYARGKYQRLTDYSEPPPAPSFGDDAAWVASLAAKATS